MPRKQGSFDCTVRIEYIDIIALQRAFLYLTLLVPSFETLTQAIAILYASGMACPCTCRAHVQLPGLKSLDEAVVSASFASCHTNKTLVRPCMANQPTACLAQAETRAQTFEQLTSDLSRTQRCRICTVDRPVPCFDSSGVL